MIYHKTTFDIYRQLYDKHMFTYFVNMSHILHWVNINVYL